MKFNVRSLLLILISLSFISIVGAHDHPIYFPESNYLNQDVLEGDPLWIMVMYYTWGFHDHIHWIFVVLMLFSCYHFRFFSGRKLFGHPRKCFVIDKEYTGERKLHMYHRYFWMVNVILIGIHWSEVITGWRFGLDYTYTFSLQGLGILAEFLYVASFTLWLFSCHYFRYFMGGKTSNYSRCASCSLRGNAYHVTSRFNRLHGIFMWMAIVSMILLIALNGHL